MKKTTLALAILSIVLVTGCATIMQGSTQDVGISSNPSSATVWANGQELGRTPLNTQLARKDNHVIKIELPGYMPYETTFNRSVSGWVWGNIVFGGLIGLAVDAVSGGLYKLTPQQVNAELIASQSGSADRQDGLFVFVTLQPKTSWQKVAELDTSNQLFN